MFECVLHSHTGCIIIYSLIIVSMRVQQPGMCEGGPEGPPKQANTTN